MNQYELLHCSHHVRQKSQCAQLFIHHLTAGTLEDIAGDLDYVLVMSVNPGFGGQAFIPHSLEKLRRVRAVLDAAGSTAAIEIDGGIDQSNAATVVAAGATILVAGNAIFGSGNAESATRALRAAAAR